MEYVSEYVLAEGVPKPPTPQLPEEYRGRPHDYLKELNRGSLPYHQSEPLLEILMLGCRPSVGSKASFV